MTQQPKTKMIIVNGRRMMYEGNGVMGRDLIRAAAAGPHRRVVIRSENCEFETIHPDSYYPEHRLINKHGDPVQIKTIPDRSKGSGEDFMNIPHSSKYGTHENNRESFRTPRLDKRWSGITAEKLGCIAAGAVIGAVAGWIIGGFFMGMCVGAFVAGAICDNR